MSPLCIRGSVLPPHFPRYSADSSKVPAIKIEQLVLSNRCSRHSRIVCCHIHPKRIGEESHPLRQPRRLTLKGKFESAVDHSLPQPDCHNSHAMVIPQVSFEPLQVSTTAICMLTTHDSSFILFWTWRVFGFMFHLGFSGRLLSIFLPCLAVRLQYLACLLIVGFKFWPRSKKGSAHCFGHYDYLLFLNLFSAHDFQRVAHTSHLLDYNDEMSGGGVTARPWHWHMWLI